MKKAPVLKMTFVVFMILAVCWNAQAAFHNSNKFDCDLFRGDDISIDFDDNTIIFECDKEDGLVEITEKYELFIDGDEIELDKYQRKLVKNYYDGFEEMIKLAKEMGIRGARIGAKGAKLGVYAVARVAKLLSEDYDTDDMERDIERKAKKIEKETEKLEELSDELEDIADDFERTHKKLRKNIDELDDLGWF
jgi:hypothetical protein